MTQIPTRRKGSKAFTLIELIVVIFIILILAVVLIVAIQYAINKAKTGDTQRLASDIKVAMQKYQEDHGSGVLPGADIEPTKNSSNFLDGNQTLLFELEKYFDPQTITDFVRYWNSQTKSVDDTGDKESRILVDGHNRPIVYFEWASANNRSSASADPESNGSSSTSRTVPSWAGKPGNYEIWSSGPDGEFGTEDDINTDGNEEKSPLEGKFED